MGRTIPRYNPNTLQAINDITSPNQFRSGFTTNEQQQYAQTKQRILDAAISEGLNINDVVRQHARQTLLDSILIEGRLYENTIATASTVTTLVKKESTSPLNQFSSLADVQQLEPKKINHNLEDLVHEKETVKFNLFNFLKKKKK